jgi:hypothetical protein
MYRHLVNRTALHLNKYIWKLELHMGGFDDIGRSGGLHAERRAAALRDRAESAAAAQMAHAEACNSGHNQSEEAERKEAIGIFLEYAKDLHIIILGRKV